MSADSRKEHLRKLIEGGGRRLEVMLPFDNVQDLNAAGRLLGTAGAAVDTIKAALAMAADRQRELDKMGRANATT